MQKKYRALRFVIGLYRVLAWVVLALGVLASIVLWSTRGSAVPVLLVVCVSGMVVGVLWCDNQLTSRVRAREEQDLVVRMDHRPFDRMAHRGSGEEPVGEVALEPLIILALGPQPGQGVKTGRAVLDLERLDQMRPPFCF